MVLRPLITLRFVGHAGGCPAGFVDSEHERHQGRRFKFRREMLDAYVEIWKDNLRAVPGGVCHHPHYRRPVDAESRNTVDLRRLKPRSPDHDPAGEPVEIGYSAGPFEIATLHLAVRCNRDSNWNPPETGTLLDKIYRRVIPGKPAGGFFRNDGADLSGEGYPEHLEEIASSDGAVECLSMAADPVSEIDRKQTSTVNVWNDWEAEITA